ncbi:MAG: hypothetical protein HYT72_04680 [Candidatus Aenigmarchaeota archaeon]|nr:hypothetical protein [Candidatus Aenigmarchaeota archaeon]
MKVIFHEKVMKKMEKFPQHVKDDIIETSVLLEQFPFARLDTKKLGSNIYRIRKGKYRMLIRTEGWL